MSEENEVLESVTKEAEDTLYPSEETEKPETEEKESTDESTDEGEKEVADSSGNEGDDTKEEKAEEKEEITYKLELKEKSLLDNSVVDSIKDFAKEHNLSNDMAQHILNKQDELISGMVGAEEEARKQELEEWRNTVINDPVIGGDNLKKTVENARAVVKKYGSESFQEILENTGYGDNPEVVKFLSKIGALMDNDTLYQPNAKGAQRSAEEVFYGNNN